MPAHIQLPDAWSQEQLRRRPSRAKQHDLDQVAARQHQVFHRHQAVSVGFTSRQIQYRIGNGDWVGIEPKVFRPAAASPTWHSRVMAATLATGGVASHLTAAALWGLTDRRRTPEVTIAGHRQVARTSALLHRSKQWDRLDQVSRHGIPTTAVDRTLLDVGATTNLTEVRGLIDEARRQSLTTWGDLHARLVRDARRGRDGCGSLRVHVEAHLFETAIPLSDWSRWFADLLVGAGLPEPAFEFRIHRRGGSLIAQVDLCYPELGIVIELDGKAYHFNHESFERDPAKRTELVAEGWRVLVFTFKQYAERPSECVERVRSTIAQSQTAA